MYSSVRPADCFRLNNNLLVHDEIDAECRDLACGLLGFGVAVNCPKFKQFRRYADFTNISIIFLTIPTSREVLLAKL